MKCITDFFKNIDNHRTAWLFAFFVGFLVVSPTIISIYNIGFENFRGVYSTFNDDEGHYLAMAKEAAEGHTSKGNVFLSEHKDNPGVSYGLSENIFGLSSRVFNVPVPFIFTVNDFFLPTIGFILLYFLFFAIIKNKNIALGFSLTFYALFLFSFGRPINPQFSFIFLVMGLLLIWKIFENFERNESSVRLAFLLGADIGMLVYIYPYYWTSLFVLYALVLFFNFLTTKNFALLKNLFVMLFTFGLFAVPYGINAMKVASSPFYNETLQRFGMLDTHLPASYINVTLLFLTFLIVFLNRSRLKNQNYIFACALPFSGIILNWQNVVTGKYLQFSSHYYQVSVLFIFITLSLVFISTSKSAEKINFKNIIGHATIVFLVVFIFYHQSGDLFRGLTVRADNTEMTELQNDRLVFGWLNDHTSPDSVTLVLDEKIAGYVPVYTRNNLYSYGYAGYYLVSDEEMEDRWVRQNIFNDKIDAEFIKENQRSIWLNKFIDKYQNASVRNKIISKINRHTLPQPELVPEAYIERVLLKYNEVRKQNLGTALKKFKIDYILLDTKTEDGANIAGAIKKEIFLKPVQEFGTRIIYKVN